MTDARERMLVDAGHVSEKGPYRRRNEDFALAYPARGVYIVADGLGGAIAGDRASRVASESVASLLASETPLEELLPDAWTRRAVETMAAQGEELTSPPAVLRLAILVAHCRVHAEARDTSCMGMATAIIVAWRRPESVWIVHVGDCRAYTLADGELSLLTRDHSLSAELADRPTVPESLRNSPFFQSRLTQVVGGEHVPEPDVRAWTPGPADARLLLCSDGVWNSLSQAELRAALAADDAAEEIGRGLVEAAIRAGSRDNATALVVRL